MVTHWDDVAWETREGVVRYERRRLGRHAGCARVGLSRYRVPPGARQMPVHEHADEEELAYVLAGDGLLWRDGTTHAVRAGDCAAFPAGGPAHTFVAGDDGMDLLIFGSGSATDLTWLPRAGRLFWRGSGWVPVGASAPDDAEEEAGALPLPGPSPRPPSLVHRDEVALRRVERGRSHAGRRDLGRAAGSVQTGLKWVAIDPGREGPPPHCHSAEEELFVVLGGSGTCVLGDEAHAVRPGSLVARPPATRVAHHFAAGGDGLEMLAYGTREPGDVSFYPRSQKVYLRGVGAIFRVDRLDYWDGEEQPPAA